MTILQIEHPIFDYDAWKVVFDSDPARRKDSGMKSYRILRPTDDPRYVIIDCEFDTTHDAQAFLGKMRDTWKLVVGKVIESPRSRLAIVVETRSC